MPMPALCCRLLDDSIPLPDLDDSENALEKKLDDENLTEEEKEEKARKEKEAKEKEHEGESDEEDEGEDEENEDEDEDEDEDEEEEEDEDEEGESGEDEDGHRHNKHKKGVSLKERRKKREGIESDEETGAGLSDEEPESRFAYHGSEENFQESDLLSRKKRRYLLGTHSFLELTDPHLETALIPGNSDDERESLEEEHEHHHEGPKGERDKYKDLCKERGIKPHPAFLKALGKRVLDLTNNGLNDKEIEAICLTLEDDTRFEICRFTGNACGKVGGLAIAEMIKKNCAIEELALANTEILEALDEICEAVSETTNLTFLDLSNNELIDVDMTPVSSMIAENQSLKTLLLKNNMIKDIGLGEFGAGLFENTSLVQLDFSRNKIRGGNDAARFFNAASQHPQLLDLDFSHNLIRNEGSNGFSRILAKNDRIEHLDLSINIMEEPAGPNIQRGLGTGKPRDLENLLFGHQWWHQEAAGAVLRPLGVAKNDMPIEVVDFGWMLDVHKSFLSAEAKALEVHPDLTIIRGQPYGLNKAKNPEEKPLIIRRANVVFENFETPLVMFMEELAKEPKTLTKAAFKKFIKQCNLYKDKSLTDAFENVFATPEGEIDRDAILEAFDKEYPGKRVIPDPNLEVEPPEPKKKKKKKKKGKGKKGKKGKKGGKSKSKVGGKGKSKPAKSKPKKGK